MQFRFMLAVACLCALGTAQAGERPEGKTLGRLAQEPGLAAKYPGDKGIAKDPDVLFAENFEGGDTSKWDETKGPVTLTAEAPHSGARCVEISMHRGKDTGGHLIKWFPPGADTVYARFYVKFSKDYQYNHHFVWLLANPPEDKWRAFGKAGLKPDGTYFAAGMEPWFAWGKNPSPGEVNLYTYYMDMEPDRKMGKYWGNAFFPPGPSKGEAAGAHRVIPPLGKWQCWEFMLQANSAPDKADGKQAMWVDGKLIGQFTGLRWRNRNDVKINCFWLEHYGYDDGDPTREYWKDQQTVWFDDIVVSRRYIGPAVPASGPVRRKTEAASKAQEAGMWKDISPEMNNPVYRPNSLFMIQEDLRAPRFAGMRSRYGLDAVVQGETDEFQRILLLRNWVHRRIVADPGKPAIDGEDALRILDEGPKGGEYHCGHLSKAQNAVMNAMGYVTRCVFAGAGEKAAPLSGAHGANEVWSNTYCKWVLMDAEHDSHFEKEGKPLSGLEIREEVLRDGGAHIVRVQGPERKPVPKEKDDSYGRTPRTYAWVSYYLEGNRHTIWPKTISAYEVVYADEYFRTHTWYRGGKKHFAYDAGYFKPVQDRSMIEWTPNVLGVKTQIRGDLADAHIVSFTPNLKEYQIKEPGDGWKPVAADFTLQLEGDREERLLRAVNLAGVSGPEYRWVMQRQRNGT